MEKGLTVGGQTVEAFYVSVKHARPLAIGLVGMGDLGRCASFMAFKGTEAEIQGLKDTRAVSKCFSR